MYDIALVVILIKFGNGKLKQISHAVVDPQLVM